MSKFKIDIKTAITWMMIIVGVVGSWYTLKGKVEVIQTTITVNALATEKQLTEIKEKQESMNEKLSGAIGSDGIQDSDIRHNEKGIDENASNLQRHIERHNP